MSIPVTLDFMSSINLKPWLIRLLAEFMSLAFIRLSRSSASIFCLETISYLKGSCKDWTRVLASKIFFSTAEICSLYYLLTFSWASLIWLKICSVLESYFGPSGFVSGLAGSFRLFCSPRDWLSPPLTAFSPSFSWLLLFSCSLASWSGFSSSSPSSSPLA